MPNPPLVAPEEAVRLVDALLIAYRRYWDGAPAEKLTALYHEARTALLNYIAAQQKVVEHSERRIARRDRKLARLTAEKEAMLTFERFREVNQDRAKFYPSCHNWILAQWSNALAGEVGEACNVIKKIDRGDFTLDDARESLADELADAFTYIDHLANLAGIDLGEAVVRKFNIVSERRGLPHRLTPKPPTDTTEGK